MIRDLQAHGAVGQHDAPRAAGSGPHFVGGRFGHAVGARLTHVPYRGGAQATTEPRQRISTGEADCGQTPGATAAMTSEPAHRFVRHSSKDNNV